MLDIDSTESEDPRSLRGTEFEPATHHRQSHYLLEPEIDELVAAREAGAEIAELAQRFLINRSTVLEHLKRRGVPHRRWPGRTLTDDQLAEAGQIYQSGLRLELVAERFNVDRRYLRKALAETGISIRRAGRLKRES